ncbi:MAG: dTMP kinase [archaeon]|nr:dTMP kinase [archaeon]
MGSRGFFCVFEGVDGSGKGTVISAVKNFLAAKGVSEEKVLLTAEPTSGFYGKKVRELLATSPRPDLNAKQFLDLYVADRKEHVEKVILPALLEGKIILCDRYKYSTFVYQSLQGIEVEKIRELHAGMPVPDLAIILDLPVETALERINSDSKRGGVDAFERKDFLEKVRRGFLDLPKVFPGEKISFVDASVPLAKVCEKVCSLIYGQLH